MNGRWLPGLLLLLLAAGCTDVGPARTGPQAQPGATTRGNPAQDRARNAPFPILAEFPAQEVEMDGPWLVAQSGDKLTAYNLETGQVLPVPTRGRLWSGFSAGGGKVVWADLRNDPRVDGAQEGQMQPNLWNWDIMLMDLATGELRQLTRDSAAQWRPHTDGQVVVWEDLRHDESKDYYGYPDIYTYDIRTGQERRLTTAPGGRFRPRVDAGKVVWMDGRNNPQTGGARGCGNCPANNWDIFGADLSTGREFTVATERVMEDSPDISGDRVVWVEHRDGGDQVWVLDLKTGQRERLTEGKVARRDVRIDGDRIVWMDERRGHATNDVVVNGQEGNADIFLYNLSSHREVRLTGDWIQMNPAVSGRRVAFIYSTQANPQAQVVQAP